MMKADEYSFFGNGTIDIVDFSFV